MYEQISISSNTFAVEISTIFYDDVILGWVFNIVKVNHSFQVNYLTLQLSLSLSRLVPVSSIVIKYTVITSLYAHVASIRNEDNNDMTNH